MYSALDVDEETLSGKYSVLKKYFVRGAPCVLSDNLATEKGLAKGTKGILEGLVWSRKDCKGSVPNMDTLERGKIHSVPQPTFILVRIKNKEIDRIVPIKYINAELELDWRKGDKINYREHPVDLLFAVTYHKLQGLTLSALVLSLNTHPNHKLRITIPSLYVGLSRVHNFDEIRVLPFWEDDVKHLTSLKSDSMLKLWFNNYTQQGIWKHDGLRSFSAALRKQNVIRLGLVDDMNMLTAEEAKKFAKDLDIHVGDLKKPGLINKLKPYYNEGREYLCANRGALLLSQRREILEQLRKQGKLGKLKIQILKQYSKRLGVNVLEVRGRRNLELALNNLLSMGLQSNAVGYKVNAVEDVKQSEGATQSMICQSENTSVQEFTIPPCTSDTVPLLALQSHDVGYKDISVEDVKQLGSANQSIGCHEENISGLGVSLPLSNSDTLPLQNSSLVASNFTKDPQPGILTGEKVDDKVLFSKEFTTNFVTQLKYCLNKQLNHGLHVVGPVTLPNGIAYDRIHNVGGGDCFFLSIAQGCQFFGININHVELRLKVGQWIQGHAYLMETQLGIQPIDLYEHMKRFPAPPQGWWSYLILMDWTQWGVHVEQLGEWVGPLEVNPTNHVLEEMGCDLRVNIYSPDGHFIIGNEENVREDGVEKPLIIVMSSGGHYEWLRMKTG